MAQPLVQQLKSEYDSAGVRAHIAALKEIRDLEREINRLKPQGSNRPPSTGGGSGGGSGGGRAPRAEVEAMRQLREVAALARIEFDKLNLSNRRGELSNEKFQASVAEMRQRVTRDLVAVRGRFEDLPRSVEIQYGRSLVALDRFATRAQEVASGQTRLRTRIGQGVTDALQGLAYRVPGGGALVGAVNGLGIGGAALAAGTVGVGAAVGMGKAVSMAISYEKALVEVRKTTGLTAEETARLGDDLLDMSARLGTSAGDLAAIAAAAGQLGITGSDHIARFTETTAKLSAVSELSAEEAADALGKIGNAFALPIVDAERLGSVVNELSNTTAATSRDIVDALTRIGPAGRSLGLTAEQSAALAATLIETGIGAERAGTQLRNVFTRVRTNAAEMAKTIGVTKAEFEGMVSSDALGALQTYLGALADLPPNLRTIRIKEIFGDENLLAVETLAQATNAGADGVSRLGRNLQTSATAWREGTSLNREYAASLDSVAGQWGIFTQRIAAGATALGSVFTPAIKGALRWFNELGASVQETASSISAMRGEVEDLKAVDVLVKRLESAQKGSDEWRKVLDELAEKYPDYVTGYDAMRKAVGVYADELREAIRLQNELLRSEIASRQGEIGGQYENASRRAGLYGEAEARLMGERARGTGYVTRRSGRESMLVPIEEEIARYRRLKLAAQQEAAQAAQQLATLFDPVATSVEQLSAAMGITEESARSLHKALKDIKAQGVTPPVVDPNPDPDSDPADPKTLAQAQDTLEAITRAQQIAAEFGAEQKKALADVFRLQDQIKTLKEQEAVLGRDAVKDQLAAADKALRQAQARLAVEKEFAEAIQWATAGFNSLVPRGTQGPLEASGTLAIRPQTTTGRILSMFDDDGRIKSGFLRTFSEEDKKRIEEIVKRLDKAKTSGEELGEAFQNIGSSLRSVTRLVDLFGELPEHTKAFLAGLADSVDNAGRLVEQIEKVRAGTASIGDLLVPGVGAVAGIASALFGFAQSYAAARRQEREEAERLAREQRQALRDNTNALRDLGRSLFTGGVVGPNVPADAAQQAATLAGEAEDWIKKLAGIQDLPEDQRLGAWMQIIEETATRLQDIDALGIESFDNLYQTFLDRAATLGYGGALEAMLTGEGGLSALLEMLAGSVGDYTKDVAGAIEQIRVYSALLGGDAVGALQRFTSFLLENVEGIGGGLQDFLAEIAGRSADGDLSEEDRDRIREIVAIVAANMPAFLGDLSPAELRAILEELIGLASGDTAGTTGEQQSSRSVQYIRTVHEGTANEMVLLLREMAYYLKMLATGGAPDGGGVPDGGGASMPSGRLSSPPAGDGGAGALLEAVLARLTAAPSTPAALAQMAGEARSLTINVGGVTLTRPLTGNLRDDIRALFEAAEEEVQRETKYRGWS